MKDKIYSPYLSMSSLLVPETDLNLLKYEEILFKLCKI